MKKSVGLKILLFFIAVGLLSACASMDSESYENQKPGFVLEEFFNGQTLAWGIVQNRSGNVVQRFTVNIDGVVEGDTITLDETFTYSLGEGVTKRVWVIERGEGGAYIGSAGDILAGATGQSYGNAFNWTYDMNLPVGEKSYQVRFDDWIWALDENTIMNRAYIKKFGLTFAEVTLFMQRKSE